VTLARDLPQQTARLPKANARRPRLEILDMVFSKDIVTGAALITNNRPTVEQEEDEV